MIPRINIAKNPLKFKSDNSRAKKDWKVFQKLLERLISSNYFENANSQGFKLSKSTVVKKSIYLFIHFIWFIYSFMYFSFRSWKYFKSKVGKVHLPHKNVFTLFDIARIEPYELAR